MSLLSLKPALIMMNGTIVGAIAQAMGATTAVMLVAVRLAGATAVAVLALPRLRRVH